MKYKFSQYNQFGKLDNGDILLYNLFSSSVATVKETEFQIIYDTKIESTAENFELISTAAQLGFVVPIDEDEYAKLLALRNSNNYSDRHAGFQILPTTGCNARCFYCYEHGFVPAVMDDQTAEATVNFILNYCENMEEVTIAWFGGEPLTCEPMMKKISELLIPEIEKRGIRYFANIITNGSLVSESNVSDIVHNYRITTAQITLDGQNEEHLRRKGFLDKHITYEHILNNIALLANNSAKVLVRINIDRNNISDCLRVLDDLAEMDANMEFIWPYVAPLYSDKDDTNCISKDELNGVFEAVFKKMIDCGFIRSIDGLPLSFSNATCCAKMLNNFVISPTGDISKCEHLLNVQEEIVGTVYTGITFNQAMVRWTDSSIPVSCQECSFLPICQAGCYAAEKRGFGYGRCSYIAFIHDAVISAANYLLKKGGEQDEYTS